MVSPKLTPTIDELVLIARKAGRADATRRTIRYWVSKQLVRPPKREGRNFLYPAVATGQVDALARWNAHHFAPGLIKFALFIETNTVPARIALQAAAHELTTLHNGWGERRQAVSSDALADEAAAAARSRGRNAVLPRRVRMSQEERTAAVFFMLGQMPGVETVIPQTDIDGEAALARALGLRSGRGGAERSVTLDRREDFASLELRAVLQALASAQPSRIEYARRVVELCYLWFPAMLPVLRSSVGVHEVPFLDIVVEWAERLTPLTYVQLFGEFVTRSAKASDRAIQDALPCVDPPAVIAALIADLDPSSMRAVCMRLRPWPQLRLYAHIARSSRRAPRRS